MYRFWGWAEDTISALSLKRFIYSSTVIVTRGIYFMYMDNDSRNSYPLLISLRDWASQSSSVFIQASQLRTIANPL